MSMFVKHARTNAPEEACHPSEQFLWQPTPANVAIIQSVTGTPLAEFFFKYG